MSDLERRLQQALRELPEGDPAARERAERAAVAALPARRSRRRPRWLLAAAVALAAVAVAGAALAATDRLAVRIGAPAPEQRATAAPAPPAGRVVLPSGVAGLGLVADGRLWLGTDSGLGVQGLQASTAELSPRALYAAVGIGRSLVAVTPGGRRAWAHPTGGPVVAAAWAPNPIVIAYLVERHNRYELRLIEGDGDGDRLVDADVAPVRPSWRADTHALAYATRAGSVRTVGYPSLAAIGTAAPPRGRVGFVAFAPMGDRLAAATAGETAEAALIGPGRTPAWSPVAGARVRVSALAWSSPDEVLVAGDERSRGERGGRLWTLPAGARLSAKASASAHGPPIAGLSPGGGGARVLVAVRAGGEAQVWQIAVPRAGGGERGLAPRRVLLRVPLGSGPVVLTRR